MVFNTTFNNISVISWLSLYIIIYLYPTFHNFFGSPENLIKKYWYIVKTKNRNLIKIISTIFFLVKDKGYTEKNVKTRVWAIFRQ